MKEKLQDFFNRFISNDNGDVTQTQKNQKGKLIIIVLALFLGLFLLMKFTSSDELTEKEIWQHIRETEDDMGQEETAEILRMKAAAIAFTKGFTGLSEEEVDAIKSKSYK